MKFFHQIILAIYLLVFCIVPAHAETQVSHPTPHLINFYLNWELTDQAVTDLAKWDVVVLDMDQQWSNPDKLRTLRQLNPNIKILAYVSASEMQLGRYLGDHASPGYKLASQIPVTWFMQRANGTSMQWWPNAWLLNVTGQSPQLNGERWNTFLPRFIKQDLLSTNLWDGIFLDGVYDDLKEKFGTDIDLDRDGKPDSVSQVTRAWQTGMSELLKNVRATLSSSQSLLINSGKKYQALADGTLFENVSEKNWSDIAAVLKSSTSTTSSPNLNAINVNTDNQNQPDNYRLMRFGLASALLSDRYFSFDFGDTDHHQTWWYDEYDLPLGKPLVRPNQLEGFWSRSFEQGLVLLNTTDKAMTTRLVDPPLYEKLRGTQDPNYNSGAIVNQVTIPAHDGMVLRRHLDVNDLLNIPFVNGTYYQVKQSNTQLERNGILAWRDDEPVGALIVQTKNKDGVITVTKQADQSSPTMIQTDLDQDGIVEQLIPSSMF